MKIDKILTYFRERAITKMVYSGLSPCLMFSVSKNTVLSAIHFNVSQEKSEIKVN